jgi:hypothetical protein
MAQPQDLMSNGVSPLLAEILSNTVNSSVPNSGTTGATAYQIPPRQYTVVVSTATNTTSGVALPVNVLIGDQFIVANSAAGTCTVYAPQSTGTSSINIGTANTTGFALVTGKMAMLWPVYVTGTPTSNSSLWIGISA